ncbi:glycosyltransferase family 2 protein [Clostridium sp. BJN0001]|uniref:glycosyltransferase n=1 Tax=Clostridium sp. BJN0001 TaxID=2930219 RepID=UPI001FD0A18E|nr:glycosyltransferase family 2 protein [Clostridium sp. BJN0001]
MKISIICPLHNGQNYLRKLNKSILNQNLLENAELEIKYVLTKSQDKTKDILDDIGAFYVEIEPSEFSHSRTREMMSKKISGDILVFISQDIKIKDEFWLKNLISPIISGECQASFSRQVGIDNGIEKYTRERNYPNESRIVSKDDIEKYQIRTFFYSDASSAVKTEIYRKLNAYDGKNMTTNEDMYFAYKLINAGYKIKYCSDSIVYHSHNFTFRQLFKRYYDTGIFFKDNPYFLNFKSNESGFDLARYVFKRAAEERNIRVLLRLIPDFATRFIAKFIGQHFSKRR